VSTPGDDKPDFSQFDLPEEGLGPLEPAEGLGPLEPVGDEMFSEPESSAEEPPFGLPGEQPIPGDLPPDSGLMPDFGAAGGLAGVGEGAPGFLGEAPLGAVDEEPKGKKKKKKAKTPKAKKEGDSEGESFLKRLQKTSPYVMILALSVVALALAILFLALELADYDFDLKAQEAKQRAALDPARYSAPAKITATA